MPHSSNWTPLHAQIHRTLRSRHLLERQQRILVAVSGGQDSLCLIKLLYDLQPKWGWQLGIAHCDHRWRLDSAANAQHVAQLAHTWQLPFYLDVAQESLKSEAAAREWRYQALGTIAAENDYHCLVTGHTASDRAETLLYNLMRGTGADGLQALTWKRGLDAQLVLVRPLLEVTRTQTGRFCQEMELTVWEDTSNQDLKYARNRIRQELLPYLRRHFNPQVEQALAQTAELLQAEVEYLELAAQNLRQEVIMPKGWGEQPPILESQSCDTVRINRSLLNQAPLSLQRRVMRQLLLDITTNSPSFEQIEKLTALVTAPNRAKTDPFPGGMIAEVQGDWICFLI